MLRPNDAYLIKVLKHQTQTGYGTKVCSKASTQYFLQKSRFLRLEHGQRGIRIDFI